MAEKKVLTLPKGKVGTTIKPVIVKKEPEEINITYQVKNPNQGDIILTSSTQPVAKDLTFKMYPIRCKSCNKPLAHLEDKYEKLLEINGGNIRQALDELNLMRQCCRISMMNPTIITHDITDRSLIEQRSLEKSKAKNIIPLGPPSRTEGKTDLSRPRAIIPLAKPVTKDIKQLNVPLIPNSGSDEIEVLDVTTYPEGMTRYQETNLLNPDEAGLSEIAEPLKFLPLERDVGCGYKVKVLDNRRYTAR